MAKGLRSRGMSSCNRPIIFLSRSSTISLFPLCPLLLPEHPPQDLSHHGWRQVNTECDLGGDLVVGHTFLCPLPDILGRYLALFIRMELNKGLDYLPLFFIGHAYNSHITDIGILIQELLHLCRKDRITLALDHVLDAIPDNGVTLGIYAGNIPCVKPAIPYCRCRLFRTVQVTLHDLRPFDNQFPGVWFCLFCLPLGHAACLGHAEGEP